jgi:hypothetical protein
MFTLSACPISLNLGQEFTRTLPFAVKGPEGNCMAYVHLFTAALTWLAVLSHLMIFADINSSLAGLAKILLGFVVGALTLAFSYGGYLWMTSNNNPSRRSEAYLYMFGASFGAIAIILAPSIAAAIQAAIK